MGATLARGGVNPQTGRRVTHPAVVKRTLAVMVTCGMYDAAGDWVSAVGLPAKSGVGGGIVAVLPGQLGIGVYSPLLDEKRNSVQGVRLCRDSSVECGADRGDALVAVGFAVCGRHAHAAEADCRCGQSPECLGLHTASLRTTAIGD